MNIARNRRLLAVVLALIGSGCVQYEAIDLQPIEAISREDDERHRALPENGGPRLPELEARMKECSPRVREALAAYRRAEARAAQSQPWPNPTIAFGPNYGTGSDVTRNSLVPFGSLGLSIPLGDRRASRDQLDRCRAASAQVEFEARLRESGLELRRRFEALALAEANKRLSDQIVTDAQRSTELARRLVDAGRGTAGDVAPFRLEEGRARLDRNTSRREVAMARAELAATVGIAPSLLGPVGINELPPLPQNGPERGALIELIAAENTLLARRRADYEEAEAALRLAVAEQYPDLELGFAGSEEAGESKRIFGLAIGIELPIFDRNQKEIAEAEARREEARERFATAANEILAALDHVLAELEIRTERLRLIENDLLIEAAENRRRARQSLAAGAGSALLLLETERQARRMELDRLTAELDLRRSWAELEESVGLALREFPGETTRKARDDKETSR